MKGGSLNPLSKSLIFGLVVLFSIKMQLQTTSSRLEYYTIPFLHFKIVILSSKEKILKTTNDTIL